LAKVREAPGLIGERGGTRTLDPMIKSHMQVGPNATTTAKR